MSSRRERSRPHHQKPPCHQKRLPLKGARRISESIKLFIGSLIKEARSADKASGRLGKLSLLLLIRCKVPKVLFDLAPGEGGKLCGHPKNQVHIVTITSRDCITGTSRNVLEQPHIELHTHSRLPIK